LGTILTKICITRAAMPEIIEAFLTCTFIAIGALKRWATFTHIVGTIMTGIAIG
jgi:hypothetical protein